MSNSFFTIQDLHYWTGIENLTLQADQNCAEVTFAPAKKLMVDTHHRRCPARDKEVATLSKQADQS